MITLQHARPYHQSAIGRVPAKELEIPAPLPIVVEYVIPAIATLGDVVRPAGNRDSGVARHEEFLILKVFPVKIERRDSKKG